MHKNVIAKICDIEERVDTQSLIYGGVNYWPLCRLRLWSHLISDSLRSTAPQAKAVSNTAPALPDVGQVNAFPFGDPTLGFVHCDKLEAARVGTEGLPNPDLLFFLRPEEYQDQIEGRAFAKILDSLYDRASEYRRLKIELSNPQAMAIKRHNASAFLHPQLVANSAQFDPPHRSLNFEILKEELDQINCTQILSQDSVDTDMGKIFYHARLFEVVLKTLKPKAVILSVYYHPVGMALMLAARRLGIKTVDVQHGRLGPHHGLYTQLTAAPSEGYHLLPDYVWCWGAQTKHDIEIDKAPNCRYHNGLVGGNPWLDRWLQADTTGSNDQPSAAAVHAKGSKNILLSLQPWETPLPDFVIDAMAKGPSDWTWWLRLHPLRRHTAPELSALLHQRGIKNFDLLRATDLAIFSVLKKCDHHVTAFSSVAVEAIAFGLRTTLFTDTGRQIFSRYVSSGLFGVAETTDSLLADIHASLDAPPPQEESPFIETNPGLAETVLAGIL